MRQAIILVTTTKTHLPVSNYALTLPLRGTHKLPHWRFIHFPFLWVSPGRLTLPSGATGRSSGRCSSVQSLAPQKKRNHNSSPRPSCSSYDCTERSETRYKSGFFFFFHHWWWPGNKIKTSFPGDHRQPSPSFAVWRRLSLFSLCHFWHSPGFCASVCFCVCVCLCFCSAPLVTPVRFYRYQCNTSETWHTWQGFLRPSCAGTALKSAPRHRMRRIWEPSETYTHIRCVSLLMCGYKQRYAVDSLWLLWGRSQLCVRECRANFENCCLWKTVQNIRITKAARNCNSDRLCINISS